MYPCSSKPKRFALPTTQAIRFGDVCEFFFEKPPGSGSRLRLRRLVLPSRGSLAPLDIGALMPIDILQSDHFNEETVHWIDGDKISQTPNIMSVVWSRAWFRLQTALGSGGRLLTACR